MKQQTFSAIFIVLIVSSTLASCFSFAQAQTQYAITFNIQGYSGTVSLYLNGTLQTFNNYWMTLRDVGVYEWSIDIPYGYTTSSWSGYIYLATMDQTQFIYFKTISRTVTFAIWPYGDGSGIISPSVAGNYQVGTTVDLSASAYMGSHFLGWFGYYPNSFWKLTLSFHNLHRD
jgi:hypothetical protein